MTKAKAWMLLAQKYEKNPMQFLCWMILPEKYDSHFLANRFSQAVDYKTRKEMHQEISEQIYPQNTLTNFLQERDETELAEIRVLACMLFSHIEAMKDE